MAIRELYAEDAVRYEADASAKGHAAISEAVTALLAHLPPNFVFSAAGPVAINCAALPEQLFREIRAPHR